MLVTLGHGTATQDQLAQLMRDAAIVSLIDVRTVPKSRRHPHFVREAMELWIPQLPAAYRWEPRLGGFRRTRPESPNVALRHPSFRGYADYMESGEFASALAELLADAKDAQTAVMCSESLWWRCHRRLIADAVELLHGVEVRHLMHDGSLRAHRPTAGVRVTPEGKLRYDVLFEEDAADDR